MRDTRSTHRTSSLLAAGFLVWIAAGQALAQSTELPNRHDPLNGITTAGQPSAEALSSVAAEGYKTVIDLRAPEEDRGIDERSTVESLGMRYVSLPVSGAGGVTYENARALDSLLENAEGPVLLHCASGNRAGALLALRAKINGADDAEALELGLASGLTSLLTAVETKLTEGPDSEP